MPYFTSLHAASIVAASSSSAKTSAAGSAGTLVFIVILGILAYFFFIRPRSAQARRQRETLQEVSVGEEILTGAGIFGRVLDVEGDRITIETAPGTRMTVLRSTIARRFTEPTEETSDWEADNDSPAASGNGHQDALGPGGPGGTVDEHENEQSGGDAAAGGEG